MYAPILVMWACTAPTHRADSSGESAGPPTEDTSDPRDTATGSDTGSALALLPWEVPGFYDDAGPLHSLFEADPTAPERAYTVRMATSPDGVTWTESDAVIASEFNSLDLLVTPTGVILTGLPASEGLALHQGSMYLLASADLTRWASREWVVSDISSVNLVDPSIHLRADGTPGLTYYACDTFGEDPVWVPGDHAIRRAAWVGGPQERWVEDPAVAYADDFLVDPVICNLNGQEWLFATQAAEHVILASGNGDGTFTGRNDLTWASQSVPYCAPRDAGLGVYAQGRGMSELATVAQFDGEDLDETGPLYAAHLWGSNNCTSPVLGWYQDQYVLFCAVNMRFAGTAD